ncbi:MAG: chemotaxis protein CheB [Geminicoccaceae bacterium]
MAAPPELFIVGIGASAGGIEAIDGMFRHMPTDSGLAFVIVAHLAPNKVSLLHEVVGRFTEMPVVQVRDEMIVEANHVYVGAPDRALTLEKGRLRSIGPDSAASTRLQHPIDLFFSSLAGERRDHAIGIVLSGGGTDGTLGIKAIKEAGGLTFAQGSDHSAPRHDSMPTSAIASGLVDIVAPVEEMGAKLVAYLRSFAPTARLLDRLPGRTAEERADNAQREIAAILREQVGHDFSGYKEKTFLRRVQRRLQVVQLADLSSYIDLLRRDPEERTLLFRDLLIGVTGFFRDTEAYAALQTLVVAKLFEGKGPTDSVRVWVPGCSTGEEVYSIAILLREQMDALPTPPKVQIFGTDIDEAALGIARSGRYTASAVEGLSDARLNRFFVNDEGIHLVTRQIRDLCIFSPHSIVRDPPFGRIDMISCRNLLIYLDADLQSRVIPVFHYALRPSGYLFLGVSENVSQKPELFIPLDKKFRVFQRRDHVAPQPQLPFLLAGTRAISTQSQARTEAASGMPFRRIVDTRILDKFAPAYVVINREGDVVHYSSRTGKYLEPPAGMPNRQIVQMARKGLRPDLRAAIQQAMETRRQVVRSPVLVETNSHVQPISLTVEAIGENDADPLFLIVFDDLGEPLDPSEASARRGLAGTVEFDLPQLETELRHTRERLQSTVEEYETALEELKAANEELVSMNEELQSTNEELETSKEEIQSVNEELQTVNSELGSKVEALNQANADLTNLFESTEIAVIFLDSSLRIRIFTPAVSSIFSLAPTDRGRALTDISHNLDLDRLEERIRTVIASGEPQEDRVARRDGSMHYLMRILPYRSGKGEMEGAITVFVDLTGPVQIENQLRLLVHELNHRARNLLTVVNALARQTASHTNSVEEFLTGFLGRIHALARAHGLLAEQHWGNVQLADLVAGEVAPHAETANRVRANGPRISLTPKAAVALGMILHELATNATKYGSLASPAGEVELSWAIESGDGTRSLRIRWHERGGQPVKFPAHVGFGSMLVERQAQNELGGSSHIDYRPEGVRVELTVPEDPDLFTLA